MNAVLADKNTVIKRYELDQTYNGCTGCACGCGGTYTESGEINAVSIRRLNVINKAIKDGLGVEFYDFGNRHCYEYIYGAEDSQGFRRVTRVYVKVA